MSTVGIVFPNLHDISIPELTKQRTMASVPFGCRYRLIDFTLSNFVNSGITHVGVITHYNYQSLMDHLGTGKDWDLARRTGGIHILPPFITAFANNRNSLYTTRLEALIGIKQFIADCPEEYVVLSDCDSVCNLDLDAMIKTHIETGADATVAVKRSYVTQQDGRRPTVVAKFDENNRVKSVYEYTDSKSAYCDVLIHITVLGRKFLEELIADSIAHGYTSLTRDVLARNTDVYDIRAFSYDGYFASIRTLTDYFYCNMDLLLPETRKALFGNKNRPVFTKVRNSSPTLYDDNATVVNSLIADGCVIKGTVENSILFRGVKVGVNTHVKNSILMQDTLTGENVYLNCVITDKNVVIRDGRVLSGNEIKPFYIDKNSYI